MRDAGCLQTTLTLPLIFQKKKSETLVASYCWFPAPPRGRQRLGTFRDGETMGEIVERWQVNSARLDAGRFKLIF